MHDLYVEPERLVAALDRARGARSMRAVALEIGVSPSTLTRLRDGRGLSARGYCAILAWLIRQEGPAESGCAHRRVYWVGGVGTLTTPPDPRRVCADCGAPIAWAGRSHEPAAEEA